MYSPARPGHVCVLCLTCSERTATDVLTIYRPKPTQTAICKYLSLFYPINARSNDRGCQAVLKNFLQTSTGIPYEYALTKYFLGAVHTVSMNYGCHHMRKRRRCNIANNHVPETILEQGIQCVSAEHAAAPGNCTKKYILPQGSHSSTWVAMWHQHTAPHLLYTAPHWPFEQPAIASGDCQESEMAAFELHRQRTTPVSAVSPPETPLRHHHQHRTPGTSTYADFCGEHASGNLAYSAIIR